jgi:SOS-response transcriptional repressor LexA
LLKTNKRSVNKLKDFGRRLEEARNDLGLNKKDFAKMIDMAPSSITRYENGEMDISVGTVKSIAEKLNISAAWLLGLDDNKYDANVPYKKIPIINQARIMPYMSFENFDGFEIVKSGRGVDFCVKMNDDGMTRAGIKAGEMVFVKRTTEAESGDVVCCVEGRNVIIRRYYKHGKHAALIEEGSNTNEKELGESVIIGKAVFTTSEVK